MLHARSAGVHRQRGRDGSPHAAPARARRATRQLDESLRRLGTDHLDLLQLHEVIHDARGFRFDAVQLPLNVLDAHFDSFERLVLPRLVAEDIGVLGMKALGDPFILDSGAATAPECLRYALGLPASVVITGIDSPAVLEQALTVTRSFSPYSEAERAALLQRTAGAAERGVWEKYKTSRHFDGTTRHPEWLGPS